MHRLERPFEDPRAGILFLAAVLVVLLGAGCHLSLLTPYDDAFFAYAAKRLAADGELLALKTRGGFFLEKPPLPVWLEGLSVAALGPNTVAARLPGMLVAAAGVLAAYALVRRRRGHAEALLFALVLATTQQFIYFARRPVTEIYLLVWVMLALLTYADARARGRPYLATAVFTALAVMTKGLVGFMPLAIIGVHLVVTRSWAELRGRPFLGAVALALLLAAPWHVAMILRFGDTFVHHYFWQTQLSFLSGTSHVDPWHSGRATSTRGTGRPSCARSSRTTGPGWRCSWRRCSRPCYGCGGRAANHGTPSHGIPNATGWSSS